MDSVQSAHAQLMVERATMTEQHQALVSALHAELAQFQETVQSTQHDRNEMQQTLMVATAECSGMRAAQVQQQTELTSKESALAQAHSECQALLDQLAALRNDQVQTHVEAEHLRVWL